MTNFTADDNFRTGITLNCSSGVTLNNVTSTNNNGTGTVGGTGGGNGINIANCQNVTINGITTFNNFFASSGFGAGIGIFNTDAYCATETTSGVVITGTVNITESPAYYEQASTPGATPPAGTQFNPGPDSATPANTYEVVFSGSGSFGYPSLSEALTFAADAIAAAIDPAATRSVTSVREISTGNFVVRQNIATTGGGTQSLAIQPAVNAAENGDEVEVGDGNYVENVLINGKSITLRSVNGRDMTTITGVSNASPLSRGTVVLLGDMDGTTVSGFTIVGFDNGNGASEDARTLSEDEPGRNQLPKHHH